MLNRKVVCIIIFLSFVSFHIINKAVCPEMVPSDVSIVNTVESISGEELYSEEAPDGTEGISLETPQLPLDEDKIKKVEVKGNGQIRSVSAYNLVESQCDDSPLIGAFGDNLMELLDQGIQVCASNIFPQNTKLYIQGFGECVVKDRMNSRYQNHVDICMGMDVEQALNFGRRQLLVRSH